ncbi:ATP-binding cassette domain-containing protein [Gemelliphila palaticanis]|uniref:ABC transporter ATP-binding protein n=1 Tax=Gemelliphila palaticanis TaxID=81950 RepID=A0ABX2SZJ4_9BACL|nr:ABC transporter ATP-binding protein [Gemella palaticanis]MBF0715789.1 ABC transporter ATP-binding protein [Gemella palaticanis]NYS47719.1 ABC transporter ATP-binding protein [Gemella palaticanis]
MKLEIKNLSKKFDKKEIFKNVDFSLDSGEILALIGRNGSGKTTLLKILVEIIEKNSGEISIDGVNIYNNPNLKQEIIYIPDRFDYFPHTKIKKIINYYKIIYPKFDENYVTENLAKNKININKKMSELSKGESALAALIIGLGCNTSFIFLDEPLDGIDVININKVIDYILDAQEKNVGLIISSHQLNYLSKISNKVFYIEKESVSDNSKEIKLENYKKYQLVYKENIPDELLNNTNVLLINSIGRVYTILVEVTDDFSEDELLKEALQYDEISVTLEDIFIFKNKGGN